MKGAIVLPANAITNEGRKKTIRSIPIEAPIAIEYNGIGYAVMMGTPTDLEDFGIGFSLSERIAESISDVREVLPFETDNGWLLKISIAENRLNRVVDRVRVRASESGCGLCGLENLEQINRPLPPITARLEVADAVLFEALNELRQHQPLNAATGGVHAAAFCTPTGTIQTVREDVGRHNALDKLIGVLAKSETNPQSGFILLSSRCSFELVEKTALAGCPLLVTVSTATSLAVERAQLAGLNLIALARSDEMLEFNGRRS